MRDRRWICVPEHVLIIGEQKRLEAAGKAADAADLSDERALLLGLGELEQVLKRIARLDRRRLRVGDLDVEDRASIGARHCYLRRWTSPECDRRARYRLGRVGWLFDGDRGRARDPSRTSAGVGARNQKKHDAVSGDQSCRYAHPRLLIAGTLGWRPVLRPVPSALLADPARIEHRLAAKIADFFHAASSCGRR